MVENVHSTRKDNVENEIEKYLVILGLRIEKMYSWRKGPIRLWIIKSLDKLCYSVEKVIQFLHIRNNGNDLSKEYALLVHQKGDKSKYKYLNTAQNSIPFDQIYGKIFPSVEELEKEFPDTDRFIDWLEQLSQH